jgi:hypothetical protein
VWKEGTSVCTPTQQEKATWGISSSLGVTSMGLDLFGLLYEFRRISNHVPNPVSFVLKKGIKKRKEAALE